MADRQSLADGVLARMRARLRSRSAKPRTEQDGTGRSQAERPLLDGTSHDPVTGLPNREAFTTLLATALRQAERRARRVAVLLVDMDRLETVYETHGYSAGDALLQAAADRLSDMAAQGEAVGRIGGNGFAVLQPEVVHRREASALAQRIAADLAWPYRIDGQELTTRVGIGIAVGGQGDGPETLLKKAGVALHQAKSDGYPAERFFEAGMDARIESLQTLERDLGKALFRRELTLAYQPLITLADGQVAGCEALLRWHHPERGTISPADFIPIAEATGLIVPIGEWALRQACRDAAGWPGRPRVAVNLSTLQFRGGNLVRTVVSALANSGLAPHRLELEVTESLFMRQEETALAILHELRGLGVRIAMDDFGTGYSSLGYLRDFPFDKIKIDRSFVSGLPESEECAAIVRAVVGLGASLGLPTTAEGVETSEQLGRIRAEGCTEGQGLLFSPPLARPELERFLEEFSPAAYRVA